MKKQGTITRDQLKRIDLRNGLRHPCAQFINILPCVPAMQEWRFRSVEMLDCSAHGMAIESNEPMTSGEQFLVKLELETISLLLYTVKECDAMDNGRYRIGAQFTSVAASPLFASRGQSVLQSVLDK